MDNEVLKETNVREALNEIYVTGILLENDLEKKLTSDGKMNVISGSVKIKTSEDNIVAVRMYANEFKKDSREINKIYTGLETVMNEYKSVAKYGLEEADHVSISRGNINFNTFFQNGKELSGATYRANFINRTSKDDNMRAEANLEVYVEKVVPEMDKDGNETGRAVVHGLVVMSPEAKNSNAIEPVKLFCEEDIAGDIMDADLQGQTALFYLDIRAMEKEVTREVPMKIGKPRTIKFTNKSNELVVTGVGDIYEEDDDNPKAYKRSTIKKLKNLREERLEAKRANATSPSASANNVGAKPAVSRLNLTGAKTGGSLY